MTGIPI